jgi:hypothetical protein
MDPAVYNAGSVGSWESAITIRTGKDGPSWVLAIHGCRSDEKFSVSRGFATLNPVPPE